VADEGNAGGSTVPTVPKPRMDAALRERDEAHAKVAELEAQLAQAAAWRQATEPKLATYQQQLTAAQQAATEAAAKHAKDREAWTAEREFVSAGIADPDGIEVATMLYGRLPAEGRPGRADWIKSLQADVSKAPKPLTPYLAAQAAGQQQGQAGAGAGAGQADAANAANRGQAAGNHNAGVVAGAGGQPAGAGKPSEAALQAARAHALATGDRSQWDALVRQMGTVPLPTGK
jgi:hypothetical protein